MLDQGEAPAGSDIAVDHETNTDVPINQLAVGGADDGGLAVLQVSRFGRRYCRLKLPRVRAFCQYYWTYMSARNERRHYGLGPRQAQEQTRRRLTESAVALHGTWARPGPR